MLEKLFGVTEQAEAISLGTTLSYMLAAVVGNYYCENGEIKLQWKTVPLWQARFEVTSSYKGASSVQFDANGGFVEMNQVECPKGTELGIPPLPQREGYRFLGWSTDPEGNNMIDRSFTVEQNTVLYAQWVEFPKYDRDQAKMYKTITERVQELILPRETISAVIPSGTAIQNLRTSYIGDGLTRDGYHLDKRVGRYLGACTMCEVLLGKSVVGNSYYPEGITQKEALAAQKSAHAAVLKPNKVTKIK